MKSFCLYIRDEDAMVDLGRQLGLAVDSGVIHLQGALGAGKTTLCRGVLRGKGYTGAVKSPTYTLVEPYELAETTLYHFDLYRLADPEELEFMGIRDYFQPGSLCVIEWPERGEGILPAADFAVNIGVEDRGRSVRIMAYTDFGELVLTRLKDVQAHS